MLIVTGEKDVVAEDVAELVASCNRLLQEDPANLTFVRSRESVIELTHPVLRRTIDDHLVLALGRAEGGSLLVPDDDSVIGVLASAYVPTESDLLGYGQVSARLLVDREYLLQALAGRIRLIIDRPPERLLYYENGGRPIVVHGAGPYGNVRSFA